MNRPLFSIGGCVYRLMVDTRHAGSLAALGAACIVRDSGPLLADIDYMHTSNLPQGRALWLRRQIDNRMIRWAVSVDGDTSFHAAALLHEMPLVDASFAIGLAPVRIGGTADLCNLNLDAEDERVQALLGDDGKVTVVPHHGRRGFWEELQAKLRSSDRRIASGGFGVAVFNLDWFRQCWADPAPERASIDTGEDIEFCRSVRARGGMIAALNIPTDHFAWGEKMTR